MSFYAYRLTGDPEADTKALKAWGLDVTVTAATGGLYVAIDDPYRWDTYMGIRHFAHVGDLVHFCTNVRPPTHIRIAKEITAADAPQDRSEE